MDNDKEKEKIGQTPRLAWNAYSKYSKVIKDINVPILGTPWHHLSDEEKFKWSHVAKEVIKNAESEILGLVRSYEVLDRNFEKAIIDANLRNQITLESLVELGKARERVWDDILKVLCIAREEHK